MKIINFTCTSLTIAMLAFPIAATAATSNETRLSPSDKAFVAKVSQGGMFEVEASKIGNSKAVRQDVIDTSVTEVHDHDLVGAKLKGIAEKLSLPFPTELNSSFKSRLEDLNSLSGPGFDAGYLKAMTAIHAVDVAAFKKEAVHGENSALRAFARETVVIVERHIGSLHAVPLPTN